MTDSICISELIRSYRTDPDSPYHRLRYCTRNYYDSLCKRLEKDGGQNKLSSITARNLRRWHAEIEATGKVAMAHSLVAMMRILFGFGATILENADCARLSAIMSNMRFKMPKARSSILTAEHVIAIRAEAHRMNRRSTALAQAFQFDLTLRQRDVLGEYVPETEPGESDTFDMDMKWLRGIRWEEIDENFIITHVTSKRQKEIVVDLKLADMVQQELLLWFGAIDRNRMPSSGPIIVSEMSGLPWRAVEYRRTWRKIADACGIPKTIKSMDTRAGAITEALKAGASLESVRKSATHSDIGMTQKYSRGDEEAIADVMKLRAANRK
jgi:hypothetical protein